MAQQNRNQLSNNWFDLWQCVTAIGIRNQICSWFHGLSSYHSTFYLARMTPSLWTWPTKSPANWRLHLQDGTFWFFSWKHAILLSQLLDSRSPWKIIMIRFMLSIGFSIDKSMHIIMSVDDIYASKVFKMQSKVTEMGKTPKWDHIFVNNIVSSKLFFLFMHISHGLELLPNHISLSVITE